MYHRCRNREGAGHCKALGQDHSRGELAMAIAEHGLEKLGSVEKPSFADTSSDIGLI